MKDEDKTKEQLINELQGLRQRIAELDKLQIENKKIRMVLPGQEELKRDLEDSKKESLNLLDDLQDAYSKLKETRAQLIQAGKMEAIGRMAAGVAHEIKNPLGIILQGVNYLEEKLSSGQKDISDALQMMKISIKRADNIIRALLDFSRPSELNIKPEDINSIIESSLTLVKHRFRLENIEIIKELGKDLPKIFGDRIKLEQVFINLFLNSIQAMEDKRKLYIRSYQIQFDINGARPREGVGRRATDNFKFKETAVVVEIEDTGIGIYGGNLKKIFDPFFTTKRPKDGTGLGLSICRNIIDMHNGLIDVESELGKGTKFMITLKIARDG